MTQRSRRASVSGRLVLDDRVADGRITIEDGRIAAVDLDDGRAAMTRTARIIAPGFVDVHVHGWGGHDAMGDAAALDGMARALLRQGVTSFLPTAVTAPLDELVAFAERVRTWMPGAPDDGAEPLGFNLEGPFLAAARARRARRADTCRRRPRCPRGDARAAHRRAAADDDRARAARRDGPHRAGSTTGAWRSRSVTRRRRSPRRAAGYEAGATSTTHLFNAMSGVDHRSPGVAVAALLDDAVYVGAHRRRDPRRSGVVAAHHAPQAAGSAAAGERRRRARGDGRRARADRRARRGGRGSAGHPGRDGDAGRIRDRARHGASATSSGPGSRCPAAVAAASRNPLALLGISDRGRIAAGQRADLVELGSDLAVRRVMRAGTWFSAAPATTPTSAPS